jgi:hypothetical protein
MATIDDVLEIQSKYGVLVPPAIVPPPDAPVPTGPAATLTSRTSNTLNVTLTNTTSSSKIYAYVTGLAINNNYSIFLLQSDGQTPYYPSSPANTQTSLAVNCDLAINGVGASRTVTIPQLAGGRIWFSVGQPLTFLLNPGPGLVEPSVLNPSDPSININWDFCEFTFNQYELFINLSAVDFFALPISLSLTNTSGNVQTVPGLTSSSLSTIASGLQAQQAKDGKPWGNLVIPGSNGPLRVLSPNSGNTMQQGLFDGYWQSYVNAVWSKYTSMPLTIDTQAEWGIVKGQVDASGNLSFPNLGSIPQPSSADVFSCSSGAFAPPAQNVAAMGNICARIAAAFNRSTLLTDANQPDGEIVSTYYQNGITNHYARIIHAATPDGRCYAFPYDDVGNGNTPDQTGSLSDGSPASLHVTVGGGVGSAQKFKVREMARQGRQMPGGVRSAPRLGRRDLSWQNGAEEEKAVLAANEASMALEVIPATKPSAGSDLEKGGASLGPTAEDEQTRLLSKPLLALIPTTISSKVEAWVRELESSRVYAYAKPVLDVFTRLLLAVLSLSVQTVLGRLGMVLAVILLTVFLSLYGRFAGLGPAN